MLCEQAAQVQAYYDGRLTAQGRGEVEDHLRSCDECAKLLADLRGLSRLIAAAPRAQLSDEAMLRLRHSLKAATDRGVLRISGWLTGAAAVILVGALFTNPARRTEATPVASASAWQMQAITPPVELADSSGGTDVVPAQWMTDELGGSGGSR
jgi:anti-sigma factor RsiW